MIVKGVLAGALMLAAAPALADAPGSDARFAATTLDVAGHGEARVPPDRATIDLGVEARAPEAADAERRASGAMAKVVETLRAHGIDPRDIQTASVSLSPQYVYAEGQPPRLTGYEAENRVGVTVDDLSRLGATLDAVVGAGATSVGQIEFGLKAPGAAEAFARLAAVKAMEDKAEAYATAAGYRVRRLVNLSEAAGAMPSPRPPMAMMSARAAPEVPIEAGEITVSVDVAGEFELAR